MNKKDTWKTEFLMDNDELVLRKLLWLNYGCKPPSISYDDREMRCKNCQINFLRDTPITIKNKFEEKQLQEKVNKHNINGRYRVKEG